MLKIIVVNFTQNFSKCFHNNYVFLNNCLNDTKIFYKLSSKFFNIYQKMRKIDFLRL